MKMEIFTRLFAARGHDAHLNLLKVDESGNRGFRFRVEKMLWMPFFDEKRRGQSD